MRATSDALSVAMQRIGEAVYGASEAGMPGDGPTPGGDDASTEGTVEGEFREV